VREQGERRRKGRNGRRGKGLVKDQGEGLRGMEEEER